jgi:hypothetical protein
MLFLFNPPTLSSLFLNFLPFFLLRSFLFFYYFLSFFVSFLIYATSFICSLFDS